MQVRNGARDPSLAAEVVVNVERRAKIRHVLDHRAVVVDLLGRWGDLECHEEHKQREKDA